MGESIISLQPVILAGGAGARLAPYSTPLCPKPFIPFDDGTSLLQQTLMRVQAPGFAAPVVVAGLAHRFMLANQLRLAGITPARIWLEQTGLNTGFAVAVATAHAMQHAPDTVLAILPSDHAIANLPAWHAAMQQATRHAVAERSIVLLTIPPTSDANAYGYIACDAQGRVKSFREKPDNAAHLRAQGWQWNSGQVIARADVLGESLAEYAPHLWQAAQHAVTASSERDAMHVLAMVTLAAEHALPFDRAVLEKSTRLVAVACACGWQDLGTPQAFAAHAGLPLPPERHYYPWGYTELIGTAAHTLSKRLTLYPGCRISLQRHRERDEHWSIMEGAAQVTLDDTALRLQPGDAVLVPRGVWHRIENVGATLLHVHEVQAGEPDERDIERAEDDYGRA